MKIFKTSLFFVLFVSILSCENSKKNNTQVTTADSVSVQQVAKPEKAMVSTPNKPFFEGSGSTPEWRIELTPKTIVFISETEGLERLSFPIPEPILAADANVKLYRAETEQASIKAQINMKACNDADETSHLYSVSVDIKRHTDEDLKHFEGCGDYILDYRLHDIWALESIKDSLITAEQFSNEIPNLEINTQEKSFSGYAGCNTMRGSLFSEQSKLRFTNIITTRKMCSPTNREAEFLKALEASISYKIDNRRLYLSNPDGNTLTFKKVD
ncbi:META domain-containing protein [Formosa haliotis]|uniref:META domain-containing protein n=1 Tax=Formosa haliotis TaxID=1555194 RepID=UPI001147699E|nr:META domain-containing protein [Formosa haliotis]